MKRTLIAMRCALLLVAGLVLSWPAHAGLVGHWMFSERDGITVADSSGQGNHGTIVNPKPVTWTNGVTGGALYFDGTTGTGSTYVSIPDKASLHIANALSCAAWVRCDDVGRDAPILAKEGIGKMCFWFGAFGTARFGVLLDRDGNSPWELMDRDQGALPPGLWAHLVSTWDGTTVRHYLNGVQLQETATLTGPLHTSDGPLIIGSNFPHVTTAFKGVIDEVRLYDHALSVSEVRALAGGTWQRVGYWPLDEGTGTNVSDLSGLGNHGVLIGGKTNTWVTGRLGKGLYVDGTIGEASTRVVIPDAPSLHIAAGISFAAWVRCDDITRDAPILAKETDGKLSYWFGTFGQNVEGAQPGNFGVLLDLDGNQPWTTYDRNQGQVPEGEWAHLASTWDGATIRHYLNGELLVEAASFPGPIYVANAHLAIGVNSAYNYTAFKGIIDEVHLFNYGLSAEEIRALYLVGAFQITSVAREGDNLRLAWQVIPGRTYVVQTNSASGWNGSAAGFADVSTPIDVPTDFAGTTTNYLHPGAMATSGGLLYRVKLLP